MTDEAKAAFEKATEGLLCVDYVPVALLSTQVVAGTNYRILCEATEVYPGAETHYAVMTVYEGLDGSANILGINAQASDTVDRLVEMIPGAINKVSNFVSGFKGKTEDAAEVAEPLSGDE